MSSQYFSSTSTMALTKETNTFTLAAPDASLADLPTELHLQILGYLPWLDLLSCEHVCKSWREVVRRLTPSRYAIAPWLPPQTFGFDAYAPLQIHKFLTEAKDKTISYQCLDGYTIEPSPFGVEEDDIVRPITSITSLRIIEKNIRPGEYLSSTPVTNLSLLSEMIVLPALLQEDEISNLGGRYWRHLPEMIKYEVKGQNNDEINDHNDDEEEEEGQGDGETGDQAEQKKTTAVPRLVVVKPHAADRLNGSYGNMTCRVTPSSQEDFENNFSILTLGKLLLVIRKSLIDNISREEKLLQEEFPELTPDEIADQKQRNAKRKLHLENAHITISGLHFERSGSPNRLAIVYSALVIPGTETRVRKTYEAPVNIDTTVEPAEKEDESPEDEDMEDAEEDE